jgi:hypothetical protein
MGLETTQFIAGLTAAWPVASDPKSQGDDHLRLIKGALQATFPNASKAFYLPAASVVAANQILLAADQNKIVMISTASGELTVALPTLTAGDAGWSCEIMKTSTDANGITVSPASGTITSKVGATNTIRVGVLGEPARFLWSGAGWFCSKPGLVGSTVNFDGTTLPTGHKVLDGSSFSATTFAELALALGTTTLRDKRGRVEAGVDTVSDLMGDVMPGSVGSIGGSEGCFIASNNLPPHSHGGTTGNMNGSSSHHHGQTGYSLASAYGGGGVNARFNVDSSLNTADTDIQHQHNFTTSTSPGLNGDPIAVVQPTIITNKLVRAC